MALRTPTRPRWPRRAARNRPRANLPTRRFTQAARHRHPIYQTSAFPLIFQAQTPQCNRQLCLSPHRCFRSRFSMAAVAGAVVAATAAVERAAAEPAAAEPEVVELAAVAAKAVPVAAREEPEER